MHAVHLEVFRFTDAVRNEAAASYTTKFQWRKLGFSATGVRDNEALQ